MQRQLVRPRPRTRPRPRPRLRCEERRSILISFVFRLVLEARYAWSLLGESLSQLAHESECECAGLEPQEDDAATREAKDKDKAEKTAKAEVRRAKVYLDILWLE